MARQDNLNKIKVFLLELNGMVVGLIWISILWAVSIPLMIMDKWSTYLVAMTIIVLGSLVHFYLMNKHLDDKIKNGKKGQS